MRNRAMDAFNGKGAHGDRDRIASDGAGMVFDVLEVTIALLELVLLKELGLPADA